MTAPKTLARTAGLLWLLVVVGGLFAVPFLFGAVGGLSELAFVAWLLVKGVRVPASKLPVPA
jgi:hypothetical protein